MFVDNPVCLIKGAKYYAVKSTNDQLESDTKELLASMLLFEYRQKNPVALSVAEECQRVVLDEGTKQNRALHIGCATGRTTLQLTKLFKEVCRNSISIPIVLLANDIAQPHEY